MPVPAKLREYSAPETEAVLAHLLVPVVAPLPLAALWLPRSSLRLAFCFSFVVGATST
jgi:hypothetical protein